MTFISSLAGAYQILQEDQDCSLFVANPDLVGMLGVGYFAEIVRQLRQDFPDRKLDLAIPCHHFPSLVFAALDHAVAGIFFDDDHPLWPKIVSIGEQRSIFIKPMCKLIDDKVKE